jgi:hypothetical protein
MQTFLPISTQNNPLPPVLNIVHEETRTRVVEWSQKTALHLDNKRLFKQALESWQILMNLTELDPQGNYRKPAGWSNHPAVKMWRGSELLLFYYIQAMITEWKARGFKTTLEVKVLSTVIKAKEVGKLGMATPAWMRDQKLFEEIVSSHRQALLVKHYEHYNQFNWPEDNGAAPTSYNYVWPIKGGKDVSNERTEVLV